jgi:lipoyl(octanoyl) transferase
VSRFVALPGEVPYGAAHALQQQLLTERIADAIPDTVLILEHASTITVGRSRGAEANVRDAGDTPVVHVERGGDVTWHGPGQLVAYPIIKLAGRRADLHLHMRSLEQAVIDLLDHYGLGGLRDSRNTGVWLAGTPAPQKVCSVGIAARKWTTWHGLALNVNVDLGAFTRIHPCGFDASVMTRMADHLAECPPAMELAPRLCETLAAALEIAPSPLLWPATSEPSDVLDAIRR